MSIQLPEVDLDQLKPSDYIQFMLNGANNNLDDPDIALRLDLWAAWYVNTVCVCLSTLAIHEMHFPGLLYSHQAWDKWRIPRYEYGSSYGERIRPILRGLNEFRLGKISNMLEELGILGVDVSDLDDQINITVDLDGIEHDELVRQGRDSWFGAVPKVIAIRQTLIDRGL